MIIGVDIDDVLADFSNTFIDYIQKKHQIRVRKHNLCYFEWYKAWGKTEEEAVAMIYEFLHSREFLSIKPKPGAKEVLWKLKKLGHRFIAITGRPATVDKKTKSWLNKHFPKIFDDYYCTDFHIVKGGKQTKGTICAQLGVDLLIDDYAGYARECVRKKIDVLLFKSPWNHNAKLIKGMTRVNNWEEVFQVINEKYKN